MAQDDDLKLTLTAAAGEHANDPAEKPVKQTHQHDAQSEPARPRSPTRPFGRNRISLPHKFRAMSASIAASSSRSGRHKLFRVGSRRVH